MRPHQPIVQLWRAVLEAQAPLSIASGLADATDDMRLALAPNGLPCLPGTALAGVLRHAVQAALDEPAARTLFGYVDGDRGSVSGIEVSMGWLHDENDMPVESLLPDLQDRVFAPLLTQLQQIRRRVRIDHRGTAVTGGHFDRAVLAAGHRFSVELALWSETADAAARDGAVLLAALRSPRLRIGGLTHSGLGRLKVQRLHGRLFNLGNKDRADLAEFIALPPGVGELGGLPVIPNGAAGGPAANLAHVKFELLAEGPMRVGGGSAPGAAGGGRVDDAPFREKRLEYPACGGLPQWTDNTVLPATAIKGALAHRVAFHDRRLRGQWCPPATGANDADAPSPAVKAFFGTAAQRRTGHAGSLWLDDVVIPDTKGGGLGVAAHTGIDRFTGGVRDGLLFKVQNLYAQAFKLAIDIDVEAANRRGADGPAWQALRDTCADLAAGRLAIGADAATGLGFVSGNCQWSGAELPSDGPDARNGTRDAA